MEQQEFFIGFAQLALVLTGFVSVFIIFLIGEADKSRANTHHATSILVGSLLSLIAALLPVVLYNYGFEGERLWWWASIGFSVISFTYFLTMLSMTVQLTRAQLAEAGYAHMISSYLLGIGAFGIVALNLIGPPVPGHYILALVINFLVPLIAFVTFSAQKVLHW